MIWGWGWFILCIGAGDLVGWGNKVHVNLNTLWALLLHATLWDLLHLHTHTMSCYALGIFSCTCIHTSCYALGIFFCTCTKTWCYNPGICGHDSFANDLVDATWKTLSVCETSHNLKPRLLVFRTLKQMIPTNSCIWRMIPLVDHDCCTNMRKTTDKWPCKWLRKMQVSYTSQSCKSLQAETDAGFCIRTCILVYTVYIHF